jgi:putative membrane protein
MLMATRIVSQQPWAFHAHPEVWVLVAALVASYAYAVRVIGPRAVPHGQSPVSRRQLTWFVIAIALLWFASDWPVHDIGENYLYSAHMLQHMVLSYFMPPLVLLATPTWLARAVIGNGRAYTAVRWLTKPVVAGVAFNAIVMITHIPGLVNAAVEPGRANGLLHYGLHLALVTTALLMWMPVCGPLPEVRISSGPTLIYLFAQSVVPTVPAGWLTFAEGAVYKAYDFPSPRLFGLSVTYDQQIAGVIMKVGGSVFLWTIVTVLFFRRFMRSSDDDYGFAARRRAVEDAKARADAHADDGALTYEQVAEAFDASPAPEEPAR